MIVDMFNTVFWKSFGLFMKNKNFELIFFSEWCIIWFLMSEINYFIWVFIDHVFKYCCIL